MKSPNFKKGSPALSRIYVFIYTCFYKHRRWFYVIAFCLYVNWKRKRSHIRSQPIDNLSPEERANIRNRAADAASARATIKNGYGKEKKVKRIKNNVNTGVSRENGQKTSGNGIESKNRRVKAQSSLKIPSTGKMINGSLQATHKNGTHEPKEKGVKKATLGDRVSWDERRSSLSAFGFDIYGGTSDNVAICGTCIDEDEKPLMRNVPKLVTSTNLGAIGTLTEVAGLPASDVALAHLERLSREFLPVVQSRGWSVRALSEMCCCDGSKNKQLPPFVVGLCESTGDGKTALHIYIRLRPPGSCHQARFFSDTELNTTMAHEIAHIAVGPHNARFFATMAEIQQEHAANLHVTSSSSARQSLVPATEGRRLGGGNWKVLGSRELRQRVAAAAVQRNKTQFTKIK